jgi:regulator of protease activity HflC (stomatin/prohibitin superfamily)
VDKAFAWIGYIVEWLGQFFPRWKVIPTTHGWIKWVRGFKVKTGGAGIVWWWPATTEIEGFPVVRQSTPLPSQIVTTTDNKTIAVSGMLVYEVSDIEKLLGHTFDPDDTVKDIAQSALTDVLGHMTWDDIKRGQGKTLDTRLKNAAKRELEDYGVNVLKFSLTTLAVCKVHRLITSQFTEGEVK